MRKLLGVFAKNRELLFVWLVLLPSVAVPVVNALTFKVVVLFYTAILSGKYYWAVATAVAMLNLMHVLNLYLERKEMAWLEWSLSGKKANMSLHALTRGWPSFVYAALLLYYIPMIAWVEEILFRFPFHGTWYGVLWGSVAFGAVHLAVKTTVRVVLGVMLLGLVLVGVYTFAGLAGAFVVHAMCNLILVFAVLYETKVRPRLVRTAEA